MRSLLGYRLRRRRRDRRRLSRWRWRGCCPRLERGHLLAERGDLEAEVGEVGGGAEKGRREMDELLHAVEKYLDLGAEQAEARDEQFPLDPGLLEEFRRRRGDEGVEHGSDDKDGEDDRENLRHDSLLRA